MPRDQEIPCIRIFYNNEWRRAIPYVFSNEQWNIAKPYIFKSYNTNGKWELCGDRILNSSSIKFYTINISGSSSVPYGNSVTYKINAAPIYADNQSVTVTINGDGYFSDNTLQTTSKTITLVNGFGTVTISSKASDDDTNGTITVTPVESYTGNLSISKNVTFCSPPPVLQTITETFNIWKTGNSVSDRWLNSSNAALTTNTILTELNDNNNNTFIQVQGKPGRTTGTANVDLDLILQNAILSHRPETINNISVTSKIIRNNGSTTNYFNFKVTMNNQVSAVSSNYSAGTSVTTNSTNMSFTDTQLTAIKDAIQSSANEKTFSLTNTVHGYANYTSWGTVNVRLLELSVNINYDAYVKPTTEIIR